MEQSKQIRNALVKLLAATKHVQREIRIDPTDTKNSRQRRAIQGLTKPIDEASAALLLPPEPEFKTVTFHTSSEKAERFEEQLSELIEGSRLEQSDSTVKVHWSRTFN